MFFDLIKKIIFEIINNINKKGTLMMRTIIVCLTTIIKFRKWNIFKGFKK